MLATFLLATQLLGDGPDQVVVISNLQPRHLQSGASWSEMRERLPETIFQYVVDGDTLFALDRRIQSLARLRQHRALVAGLLASKPTTPGLRGSLGPEAGLIVSELIRLYKPGAKADGFQDALWDIRPGAAVVLTAGDKRIEMSAGFSRSKDEELALRDQTLDRSVPFDAEFKPDDKWMRERNANVMSALNLSSWWATSASLRASQFRRAGQIFFDETQKLSDGLAPSIYQLLVAACDGIGLTAADLESTEPRSISSLHPKLAYQVEGQIRINWREFGFASQVEAETFLTNCKVSSVKPEVSAAVVTQDGKKGQRFAVTLTPK